MQLPWRELLLKDQANLKHTDQTFYDHRLAKQLQIITLYLRAWLLVWGVCTDKLHFGLICQKDIVPKVLCFFPIKTRLPWSKAYSIMSRGWFLLIRPLWICFKAIDLFDCEACTIRHKKQLYWDLNQRLFPLFPLIVMESYHRMLTNSWCVITTWDWPYQGP